MDNNICYEIGKYKISKRCLLTYPCKHYITNLETGEQHLLLGDKIFVILQKDGLSIPHFDSYKEFIRKRDNPTMEELAEKVLHDIKIAEQHEIYKK